MKVWRVEHGRTGYGPYWSRGASGNLPERIRNELEGLLGDHTWLSRVPAPREDGTGPVKAGLERCGFATMRQLRAWFWKAERRKLAELGFVLRQYDVPTDAVRRGHRQVVFPKAKATLVTERALVA